MRYLLLTLFVIFSLFSCSGYRLVNNDNPFKQHGIKSITIPEFVTRASISGVSSPMTKEIFLALAKYKGLKIYSGVDRRADAILLGIISNGRKRMEGVKRSDELITSGTLSNSIGGRRDFYVGSKSIVKLTLRLVLIKNPSWRGVELIKELPSDIELSGPNIIFNQNLTLTTSYSRVNVGYGSTINPDSGAPVNHTKNRALLNKSVKTLSVQAANRFKEVIINAF